jgi:spore coat protein H
MVRAFVTLFGLACLMACSPESDDPGDLYPDWTDESHSNNVDPNYDVVFTQNSVNTLEITMTSSNWSAIQKDMVAKFGAAFGSGNVQGGGGAVFATAEPDYVPVSFKFNGIEWYNVGFRLKGNSTLSNAWRNGNYKLPFRLNFDEYEDDLRG